MSQIAPHPDEEQFDSLSLRSLSADGEGQVDTYDLIKNFAGPNPIEAPDLYEVNHPGSPHIFEATDQEVGDHFVFAKTKWSPTSWSVASKI